MKHKAIPDGSSLSIGFWTASSSAGVFDGVECVLSAFFVFLRECLMGTLAFTGLPSKYLKVVMKDNNICIMLKKATMIKLKNVYLNVLAVPSNLIRGAGSPCQSLDEL